MKVIINGARLAFEGIYEPRAVQGGEARCGAKLILDPRTQQAEIKKIVDAINTACLEEFKDQGPMMLQQMKARGDVCLQDGAAKAMYEGFAGNVFISSSNKARPIVAAHRRHNGKPVRVTKSGQAFIANDSGVLEPISEAELGWQVIAPYGGCYVNASLDVWAQNMQQYSKRVNAKLLAVQFLREGPAFTGGEGYDEADFEDVSGGGSTTISADGFFTSAAPVIVPVVASAGDFFAPASSSFF